MEHRFFAPHIVLDFPLDAFDTVSTHDLVGGHLKQRIGRIEVAIHAAVAQPDIAAKLDAPAGSPLLLRRHTMFSTDGRVILYGEAHYREPFAFRYVAEAGQQF